MAAALIGLVANHGADTVENLTQTAREIGNAMADGDGVP